MIKLVQWYCNYICAWTSLFKNPHISVSQVFFKLKIQFVHRTKTNMWLKGNVVIKTITFVKKMFLQFVLKNIQYKVHNYLFLIWHLLKPSHILPKVTQKKTLKWCMKEDLLLIWQINKVQKKLEKHTTVQRRTPIRVNWML